MAFFNKTGRWRALRSLLFGLIFGLLNWTLGRIYVHKETVRTRAGLIEKEFSRCRGRLKPWP